MRQLNFSGMHYHPAKKSCEGDKLSRQIVIPCSSAIRLLDFVQPQHTRQPFNSIGLDTFVLPNRAILNKNPASYKDKNPARLP